MTVSNETNRSGPYAGNGSTKIFPYGFRILADSHIRVIRSQAGVETILTKGTDYSVSGVGASGGGSVTLVVAPIAGQSLTMLRDMPFKQEVDLENQGAYYAETVEQALDESTMRAQQVREMAGRALRAQASDSQLLRELPRAAERAGKVLEFDEGGEPVATRRIGEFLAAVAAAGASAEAAAGSASAAGQSAAEAQAAKNTVVAAIATGVAARDQAVAARDAAAASAEAGSGSASDAAGSASTSSAAASSATGSAASAAGSAGVSTTKAEEAAASAGLAVVKAGDATAAAATATSKATIAVNAADAVVGYADDAEAAASIATTKAGEASASAVIANTKAGEAAASAASAGGSATIATNRAAESNAKAGEAAASASTAVGAATTSTAKAGEAAASASLANTKAGEASASAATANAAAATVATQVGNLNTAALNLTGGATGQALTKKSGTNFDYEWQTIGTGSLGDMLRSTYDPSGKNADVYAMANMVEGTTAKIFTAAERARLAAMADNATANLGTVTSVGLALPTGFTVSAAVTASGTLTGAWATGYQAYTTAEANKLGNIAANATANDTDVNLRKRADHTGVMPISALDATGIGTAFLVGRIAASGLAGTVALSSSAGNNTVAFRGSDGLFVVNTAVNAGNPVTLAQLEAVGSKAATSSAIGMVELSTAAEYRSLAGTALAVTNDAVKDALAEVSLPISSGAIAWDMSAGINFVVNMTASAQLSNPSAVTNGKSGRIRFIQDATGGRVLSIASNLKTAGGMGITLSTAPNAVDIVYYDAVSGTFTCLSPTKDWK